MHRGRHFDAATLNGRLAAPTDPCWRRPPYPFLIVPGYTPRFGWKEGLHPKNRERLELALAALRAGLGHAVIVSGAAVHSPDNEALLMREWLLAAGLPSEQIAIEPCARHTTTNLRNAGRMILAFGFQDALVVSSDAPAWIGSGPRMRFIEQSYYLGFPRLSGFHARCLIELGYRVGDLEWLAPHRVHFRPSRNVFRPSWKERRAGDP